MPNRFHRCHRAYKDDWWFQETSSDSQRWRLLVGITSRFQRQCVGCTHATIHSQKRGLFLERTICSRGDKSLSKLLAISRDDVSVKRQLVASRDDGLLGLRFLGDMAFHSQGWWIDLEDDGYLVKTIWSFPETTYSCQWRLVIVTDIGYSLLRLVASRRSYCLFSEMVVVSRNKGDGSLIKETTSRC